MTNGYILMWYMAETRDAMTYAYMDLLNAIPNKENVIAIVPSCCEREEFSADFFRLIKENITAAKGAKRKICAYCSLMKGILKINKKFPIRYIFVEHLCKLQFLLGLFLYFPNARFTFTLHDPVLHEGEKLRARINRVLSELIVIQMMSGVIVTYSGALKIMKDNLWLRKKLSCTEVIPLYWMREQEFPDIRDADHVIQYDYIFYGRIEAYKGLDLLISAFEDARMKETKLLIVGRGNDDVRVSLLVSGLSNVVFVNEFVSDRDLAKYICKSRMVILPYKSATGSQTVAVANYYGKMVLATKVGCFPDYISEGKNGFFITEYTRESIIEAVLKAKDYNVETNRESIHEEYVKFDTGKIAKKYYEMIVNADE